MKKISEILKKNRKSKGMTSQDLANYLKCSQQFISQIETDKRSIPRDKLDMLKEIMSVEEYQELLQAIAFDRLKDIKDELEEVKTSSKVSKILYFDDIQASAGLGSINEYEGEREYIEVPGDMESIYNTAIRVNGDSMQPEFKQGDIIIIDTSRKEILKNKYYVVNYDNYVYLKQLVRKGVKWYLHSINPYYPDLEIQKDVECKVIGQVISVLRNY